MLNEQDTTACPECGDTEYIKNQLCNACGYESALITTPLRYSPQFALTAELVKKEGAVLFDHDMGALWHLGKGDVQLFLKRIESKFRRKGKLHGFIKKDTLPLSTPDAFTRYINDNFGFEDFVSAIMKKMKLEANAEKSTLVGGALIFIHYKTDDDMAGLGRLLVLMVDKKGVFEFDDNLVPEQLTSIDIDSLRQAAMIDLTLFEASYPENNGESYVGFISGKSKSEFFKRALGCDPKIDNQRSISEVFRALADFIETLNLSMSEEDAVDQKIQEFVHKKSKDIHDKKITIQDIQEQIDRILPNDHKGKGKFKDFVNLNEYKVDEVFEPTVHSVKKAVSIDLKDENGNYSCKISRNVLGGKNDGKPVTFDKQARRLIIELSDQEVDSLDAFVKE
ncbi:TPA: nucleoid-associated protein [Serratia marcescens]